MVVKEGVTAQISMGQDGDTVSQRHLVIQDYPIRKIKQRIITYKQSLPSCNPLNKTHLVTINDSGGMKYYNFAYSNLDNT